MLTFHSPVEIMNTAIRAKATALTSMAAWLANFMIGQVSPTAFKNIGGFSLSFGSCLRLALVDISNKTDSIGWHYYLVFTVCGFTNALTFYLLFPETRGRTLEEMDAYFKDTHWIVPLSKTQHVSSHTREHQLAGMFPFDPNEPAFTDCRVGESSADVVDQGAEKQDEARLDHV